MTDLEYTRRQQYINELESGPKTTRDMAVSLGISGHSVAVMMKRLRTAGVVKSSRVVGVCGNIWSHELTEEWQAKYVESTMPKRRTIQATPMHPQTITPEMIYIARLRDDGWTGQRLVAKHQEQYPDTNSGQVHYLVSLARRAGLCR